MTFSFSIGRTARALAAAALTAAAAPACAQTIGVVAPLTDAMALLGNQMRQGVEVAAAERGIAADRLRFVDDACTAEGGKRAAVDLIAEGVSIVIGFLCTEAIEAALPLFKEAAIPVITPGVRTDSLTERRDRTGWPVWRIAPRADGERDAAAALLLPRWRDALYALVDDGTIYGRELIESFRLAAETAGLKAVFVDTYRPQMENQVGLLGRLRRAGATHVLVGGDRLDVAVMARDAAELNYPITIAGGENLRAADADVPLREGVLMVGLPEPADVAAPEVLEAFAAREVIPEGYVLPAYAALEIAAQSLVEAEMAGSSVAAALASKTFDTALGPIRFDDKGDLSESPYGLFRYDGQKFVPAS